MNLLLLFSDECPAGTRKSGDECEPCDFGTYQDQAGQAECKPCPAGTNTTHQQAKQLSNCKGMPYTLICRLTG